MHHRPAGTHARNGSSSPGACWVHDRSPAVAMQMPKRYTLPKHDKRHSAHPHSKDQAQLIRLQLQRLTGHVTPAGPIHHFKHWMAASRCNAQKRRQPTLRSLRQTVDQLARSGQAGPAFLTAAHEGTGLAKLRQELDGKVGGLL